MRVAVIANGPSVLAHHWGEAIDACDVVIRMNCFSTIDAYRKHVGSRTDVYVTYFQPNGGLFALAERVKEIWWAVVGDDVRDVLEPRKRPWVAWCAEHGKVLQEIPQDTVERTYTALGITAVERRCQKKPTCGMVTLMYALERYAGHEVYAAGYDGYVRSGSAYYYRQSPIAEWELRKVCADKQRALYAELVASGKVREFA
jgi:hypothetical protein